VFWLILVGFGCENLVGVIACVLILLLFFFGGGVFLGVV
jgi:hypothetical protein